MGRKIKAERRFPIFGIKRVVVIHRAREKEPPMRGYQYHPPKKRMRDKLREIWKILRE